MAPLGPFEDRPQLAVGVSGGPDSLALAVLTQAWAVEHGGHVTGLVVDHGLQTGSTGVARVAAAQLEGLGIPAIILSWIGPKPSSRLQERAREARHGLLAEACRQRGILHLCLAHHRDDQRETVAMRLARSSGPDGLAGMAAVREIEGLRMLRPLLGVTRARLLATLRARGLSWHEDAANSDRRFERARLRLDPPSSMPMPEIVRSAGIDRSRREMALAHWLVEHTTVHALGFALFDRLAWIGCDDELGKAALANAIATVGGSERTPSPLAIAALAKRLRVAEAAYAMTLGGCIIRLRDKTIVIAREDVAIPPMPVVDDRPLRWDGRFIVHLDTAPHGARIAALGEMGLRMLDADCRKAMRKALVPATPLLGLPALWVGERPVRVAAPLALQERFNDAGRMTATFSPARPLAPPPFLPNDIVSRDANLI